MVDEKPWYQSRTIWGALLAVGATFAGSLGIMVEPAIQNDLADVFVRLAGALGALIAIYGRLAATDIIS